MGATTFPYTLYTCPCSTTTASSFLPTSASATTSAAANVAENRRVSRQSRNPSPSKRDRSSFTHASGHQPAHQVTYSGDDGDDDGEETTFNPHSARSNLALFTLDSLLFCDECNQIRCPKCWQEEVINWYCPNCLFEVPSSVVRSDGNRCSRACYQCPVCTSTLSIVAHDPATTKTSGIGASATGGGGLLRPPDAKADGTSATVDSYILQCPHCEWSSLDLGLEFGSARKIVEELKKQRREGWSNRSRTEIRHREGEEGEGVDQVQRGGDSSRRQRDRDQAFDDLSKFYREQLDEASDGQNAFRNSPYSSPANLARIMSLYGGLNHVSLRKSREKPQPMREALTVDEGLETFTADGNVDEEQVLEKMRLLGWQGTSTADQRLAAPANFDARFAEDLWPVAFALRTRRGKRCRNCRQFVARPEPKVSSFRYKIRLLALNHIPRLAIRPLNATSRTQNPAFRMKLDPVEETRLQPLQPQQYILTVRNPIFETVRITLASPNTTPGRIASRVTILCPAFDVGPAGDVWDDALSASDAARPPDGGRKAAMASLTGAAAAADPGDRQPEAGKVWEKTRNSTSVIVEVVPGAVGGLADRAKGDAGVNEDVLEVPVFVRAEWKAEPQGQSEIEARGKEKEARELAYWCVLGFGRIAS